MMELPIGVMTSFGLKSMILAFDIIFRNSRGSSSWMLRRNGCRFSRVSKREILSDVLSYLSRFTSPRISFGKTME